MFRFAAWNNESEYPHASRDPSTRAASLQIELVMTADRRYAWENALRANRRHVIAASSVRDRPRSGAHRNNSSVQRPRGPSSCENVRCSCEPRNWRTPTDPTRLLGHNRSDDANRTSRSVRTPIPSAFSGNRSRNRRNDGTLGVDNSCHATTSLRQRLPPTLLTLLLRFQSNVVVIPYDEGNSSTAQCTALRWSSLIVSRLVKIPMPRQQR